MYSITSESAVVVKFYVGDRVYKQPVLPNLSATLGDNQFEVAVKVPNTVVLGESYISLSRRQNQLVEQSGTEPVYKEIQYNSNPIWLDAGAEYVFAALKGADAVAVLNGKDPESVVAASSSSNLLLSTIPVGDGATDSPRDLAVTSDGTRVYVALEQSGRVALVDPMVLQQVDTKPDIALRANVRTVFKCCIYTFSYSFKLFKSLSHPCF